MTNQIQGVEIFSVGTWNGDTYTQADLDHMVDAFRQTSTTLRPPLKLGHDDNQKLLQKDGLPAAGWISNLYSLGGKLLADFTEIPSKIFELLQKGAYRKVSSEIFWNADLNGTKFPRMLSAVSLLGADMPAVTNLADILARYQLQAQEIKSYAFEDSGLIIKSYKNFTGGTMKTETELKLELDLESEKKKAGELAEQLKSYEKSIEEKDAETAELKKFKAEAEAKAIEAEKALAEAALEKNISDMQAEKLVSPAMKPYIKALLSEEKKEYTIAIQDKSEEKFSKAQLLTEILKLHATVNSVNTEESSEDHKVEGDKEKADHLKIEQYAKEHKISYSAAYKAVKKTA